MSADAHASARLPTFVVIGAARSGTTALYTYLRQHPQVFMTDPKEPNFFAFAGEAMDFQGPGAEFVNNSVTTLPAYQRLFAAAPPGHARGEASPLYLWSPHAAARLRSLVPNVRLIAILRNPVEQAYSHFLYARKEMIEPERDFGVALDAAASRRVAHWQPLFQYATFARYGEQLQRFLAHFPRDQLRVFLYDDFLADPLRLVQDIFAFIGVRDDFAPDLRARLNSGGVPRRERLQRLVMRPSAATAVAGMLLPRQARRWLRERIAGANLAHPPMPAHARARLRDELMDDIERLQAIIGRDLSAWRA
ncbi:MAG: sulfotransferase [Casimicrobiaceae bacterium]